MVLKRQVSEETEEEVRQKREKFINGAEFVAANIPKKEWSRIVLRIKTEAIAEIDAIVENTMGLNRTSWILQAIEEKLRRTTNER